MKQCNSITIYFGGLLDEYFGLAKNGRLIYFYSMTIPTTGCDPEYI